MSFNDPQWGRSAGSDKPRNDEQENQQNQDRNQPDPRDDETVATRPNDRLAATIAAI